MSSTTMGEVDASETVHRYSPAMQALHWLVALLMFAVLPLAWVMVSLPRTDPSREVLYTLHKSIGLTILMLAAVRLILRALKPIPREPAGTPRWVRVAAITSHWLLYAILLTMPVSGYLLSSAGGAAVSYFGLFDLPALPKNPNLREAALSVHLTVQWAVYALIALHVAATAWHVAVRRDGLLERELPPQRIQ